MMDLGGLDYLGNSDLDGRIDGLQVVGTGSRLFISHLFSAGVTEVDASDPRSPRVLGFIPAPPGSWSLHLQVQGDLLMVANAPDLWSLPADFNPGISDFGSEQTTFAAGVRIFDVAIPGQPREIGFADIGGGGVHRLWFDGSDVAYASAFPRGAKDSVLMVLKVSDPAKPVEVDRYWIPGTQFAEEDQATWPEGYRVSLHHATVRDGYAYGAWRDGGVTIHPVSPSGQLGEATRIAWDGPYGGGSAAHSAVKLPGTALLAVAEEGIEDSGEPQRRVVSLVDVSDPANPARIGSLPRPEVEPIAGARFGPHNLYEYRPGAWEDGHVVFSAHQGAGLRIYDVKDDGTGREIAHFLADTPAHSIDPRPHRALVRQTNDAFVTREGIIAVVDVNRGLDLLELHLD